MNRIIISALIALLAITTLTAMPPHPDLIDEYKRDAEMPVLTSRIAAQNSRTASAISNASFPYFGNREVLVLLIGFQDDIIGSSPSALDDSVTEDFYETLFNGSSSAALSWKKYYQDMSNGALNLNFTVKDAGTASGNLADYGENVNGEDTDPRSLVEEAIGNIDGLFDFSPFDNDNDGAVDALIVIHAGAGEEVGKLDASDTLYADRIWSHMWAIDTYTTDDQNINNDFVTISTYSIQPEFYKTPGDSTIGVFVHEFGHILGMPDLYDTSYLTQGIGNWGVMSGGSWAGPGFNGSQPVPMIAWTKYYLNWLSFDQISPTAAYLFSGFKSENILTLSLVIMLTFIYLIRQFIRNKKSWSGMIFFPFSLAAIILFTACGAKGTALDLILADVETSHRASIIDLDSNEFFILENKVKKTGTWTEYLPSSGILITHVDNSAIGSKQWDLNDYSIDNKLGVKIVEADGLNNLMTDGDYSGYYTDTFYSGNVNELTDYMTNDGVTAPVQITDVGSIGSTITYRAFFPE